MSTKRPVRKKATKKTAGVATPRKKTARKKTTAKKAPARKKVTAKKKAVTKKKAVAKKKATAKKKTPPRKKVAAKKKATPRKKATAKKKTPARKKTPRPIANARGYGAAGALESVDAGTSSNGSRTPAPEPSWFDRVKEFVRNLYDV